MLTAEPPVAVLVALAGEVIKKALEEETLEISNSPVRLELVSPPGAEVTPDKVTKSP